MQYRSYNHDMLGVCGDRQQFSPLSGSASFHQVLWLLPADNVAMISWDKSKHETCRTTKRKQRRRPRKTGPKSKVTPAVFREPRFWQLKLKLCHPSHSFPGQAIQPQCTRPDSPPNHSTDGCHGAKTCDRFSTENKRTRAEPPEFRSVQKYLPKNTAPMQIKHHWISNQNNVR